MRFPHAHSGVKKLFICELIGIIATTLAVVGAILAAIGLKKNALLLTGGSLLLASGIALVVVFILQLVGLHQAGKDELQIKYAFCLVIIGVVLSLIASILSALSSHPVLVTIGKYFAIAVDVATVIALEYTLSGIATLAGKLGNEKMRKMGEGLALAVLILFIVSIVLSLYATILNANVKDWVKITVSVASVLAALAELVVSLLTLVYYGKSTKMLKE